MDYFPDEESPYFIRNENAPAVLTGTIMPDADDALLYAPHLDAAVSHDAMLTSTLNTSTQLDLDHLPLNPGALPLNSAALPLNTATLSFNATALPLNTAAPSLNAAALPLNTAAPLVTQHDPQLTMANVPTLPTRSPTPIQQQQHPQLVQFNHLPLNTTAPLESPLESQLIMANVPTLPTSSHILSQQQQQQLMQNQIIQRYAFVHGVPPVVPSGVGNPVSTTVSAPFASTPNTALATNLATAVSPAAGPGAALTPTEVSSPIDPATVYFSVPSQLSKPQQQTVGGIRRTNFTPNVFSSPADIQSVQAVPVVTNMQGVDMSATYPAGSAVATPAHFLNVPPVVTSFPSTFDIEDQGCATEAATDLAMQASLMMSDRDLGQIPIPELLDTINPHLINEFAKRAPDVMAALVKQHETSAQLGITKRTFAANVSQAMAPDSSVTFVQPQIPMVQTAGMPLPYAPMADHRIRAAIATAPDTLQTCNIGEPPSSAAQVLSTKSFGFDSPAPATSVAPVYDQNVPEIQKVGLKRSKPSPPKSEMYLAGSSQNTGTSNRMDVLPISSNGEPVTPAIAQPFVSYSTEMATGVVPGAVPSGLNGGADDDDECDTSKRAMRAERNRQSAAASRERKKNHIKELERRVSILSAENAQLQVGQLDTFRQRIAKERELLKENQELKKKVVQQDMKIHELSQKLVDANISETSLKRPSTWSHSDWNRASLVCSTISWTSRGQNSGEGKNRDGEEADHNLPGSKS